MHIIDLSIKRPVTVLMGSLVLVIFGILAFSAMPVSLMPETIIPIVTVQTIYAGASPLVIETQITKKIEDQVFSIAGLNYITSYSMDGVSIVIARFRDGVNENIALQEVKDKIDEIATDFPTGARKSVISKVNISGTPILDILIEGDMNATDLYMYASTIIRDQLAQVPGVGSVDISGGRRREIHVELHRLPVFERFLPVEHIAAILARANMELPGGNFIFDNQDIPVRFKGEFSSLEEIGNIDIATLAGVFKLRQLADIYDSHNVVRERTIFLDNETGSRNDNALLFRIMKNPSANTVSVIDGIIKRIPQIEQNSGNRVRLNVIREDARFIRDSVNDTLRNLIMGIILTGLVLMVFLHDWRSTIIISLSMPFSIISTFFVMQYLHIGINVLSLMGLSCAVGTLVANSVIVLENMFRHREQGLSREKAASAGAKEVIMAIIASTSTNVVVFIPLGSLPGAMGQIISAFAYTVVISTIFSIVVSFTITPLLASRLLPEKQTKKNEILSLKLEAFFRKLEYLYGKSISFLVMRKRRSAVLIAVVFIAFICSIRVFSKIEMELVPKGDGGKIQVIVELPQGSSLEQTAVMLTEIESRLGEYKEVKTILTTLGNAGAMNRDVNVAQMDISLIPKNKRSLSNDAVAAAMIITLSNVPGADIKVVAPPELVITQGAPINLYLKGTDGAVLQELAVLLRQRLAQVSGITNAAINTKAGKRELVFKPNRKQILQDDLTVQMVAVSLRSTINGIVSTTFREVLGPWAGTEYDILVKMSNESLQSIEDIRNIPIVTNSGIYPLSHYADVSFENGYNMIMRVNKQRSVEFTADILSGHTQGTVLADVIRVINEINLPAGYSVSQAGLSDAMSESMVSMIIVFISAILLVYMILAAILENLTQPLFILSTIPLSFIGVTAITLLTNTVLNYFAMVGILMLIGIVVNNAILLLDYYNHLRREGFNLHDSLTRACPAKLKAILMSNIAIIFGIIPMALGIGESLVEMRRPMGIVVIGGITSSMIITLWFIPCLEFAFSRNAKKGA